MRANRLSTEKAVLEKAVSAKKSKKSASGVIVEGVDNILIKFSRCCSPVPGDPIVGFITRGYGVSVHCTDCENARPAQHKNSGERWIKVSWAQDIAETYSSSLQLTAKSRDGLVLDVASALSNMKAALRLLNARDLGDGYAVVSIGLEVHNLDELQTISTRLTRVPGVIEVKRHPITN